jgi:hypothetical protein
VQREGPINALVVGQLHRRKKITALTEH